MQYTQEITLDLNSNTAYTTLGAKQGDNNTRLVIVHITENGIDYNLSQNEIDTAYFRFRKPDGKAVINSATVNTDNNTIEVLLSAQALAVAGRGYADITLQTGSQILSTVSFILIIMSSPQVANEALSSSEFGYLNAVVSDATHTMYQSEAWAEGTRGGIPVYSENEFPDPTFISSVINTVNINKDLFLEKVTSKPGTKRTFVFTYDNSIWKLVTTTEEGVTKSETYPEVISSLDSYYITTNLGDVPPNDGDSIIVVIKEKDLAYENNALYYSELAHSSQQAIENLSVSAESVPDLEHGGQAQVIKTIVDNVVNFHFKIPKGDVGDVNFMSFDIDSNPTSPSYGQLLMYKPDHISPQVDFEIISSGVNEGCLGIQVNMGGN